MFDDSIKRVPISDLRQEEGAQELATSPDMEPYLQFAMAVMQGADPTAELDAIRRLPLEKRYVWRVASALKWGFADFDDPSVSAAVLSHWRFAVHRLVGGDQARVPERRSDLEGRPLSLSGWSQSAGGTRTRSGCAHRRTEGTKLFCRRQGLCVLDGLRAFVSRTVETKGR